MWGHMPETVTAADGTVFKRPLLLKELAYQTGRTSTSEDNENWALFNINYASFSTTYSGCGTNYIPTQAGLTSLFANNAGNTMKTVQGWRWQRAIYPTLPTTAAWSSVTTRR